jgi:hypothetical protein
VSEIAVIYLLWGPLGAAPLERFVASYAGHPPGIAHRLILLLKDVSSAELRDRCASIAAGLDGECLVISPAGLDLDSYRRAADRVEADAICFLNSASEILGDQWLGHLAAALACPGVGIVGTSASSESLLTAVPRPLRPLLRRRFPPFPNPHLRTNGFMLEQETLRSLDWPPASRKQDAWALESGRRSLTRQIAARGQTPILVGRGGARFTPDQWAGSNIFRSGAQENLLIADNRTREYDDADPARRAALTRASWGVCAESS